MGLVEWLDRRVVPWFAARGWARRMVALEVAGRKSGQPRRVAVATVRLGTERFLVSVQGQSNWVRNVRAAGGQAVLIAGGRTAVRLKEVPVAERAPVLQAYVSDGVFGRSAADIAAQFGVTPSASLEEMAALAAEHPVFQIVE